MSDVDELERFGERFIAQVRDNTLDYYLALVEGRMKAPDDVRISERLDELNPEKKEFIKEVVTRMIDNSLHNFLYLFEAEEGFKLVSQDDDDREYNLNEVSDGLCGELYSDEGWIEKHSSYETYL